MDQLKGPSAFFVTFKSFKDISLFLTLLLITSLFHPDMCYAINDKLEDEGGGQNGDSGRTVCEGWPRGSNQKVFEMTKCNMCLKYFS